MPPIYKGASEQQFQEWEALLEQGISPFQAAQDVGTTLSALSRGDQVRKQNGMDLSKERRAALVDKRIDELAAKSDPAPAIITAWAKANHDDYRDKTKVEISGPDGGPIAVEGRAVVGLAAVVRFAQSIGHGDLLGLDAGDPGDALSPAQEVLPDARERERPPGVLPPARPA